MFHIKKKKSFMLTCLFRHAKHYKIQRRKKKVFHNTFFLVNRFVWIEGEREGIE